MRLGVFSVMLLLSCTILSAENIPVQSIGISQGLSNNSATSIVQDKFGFIWIGTFDGLNRYDGFEFKVFRNKWRDTASLINNHIVTLGVSKTGVWAGSLKGVSFFDYAHQVFQSFNYRPFNTGNIQKLEARCNELFITNDTVYLGTDDKGLLILEPGRKWFSQILYNTIADYNVQGICEYNGTLYLFIKNIGLCSFDRKTRRIRLVSDRITDGGKLLPVPGQHLIYIGSQNGLFQYNIHSRKIEASIYNKDIPARNVTGLLLSRNGRLWVSTDGGGIAVFNTAGAPMDYITAGNAASQLKSGAVYSVFEDRESRKWIATLRGGIGIADNKKLLFESVKKDPFNKNSLVSNFTLSFSEDAGHDIWIGTDGGGLSRWDPGANSFSNFTHNAGDPGSLGSNFVVSLLADYRNRLWVATFGGGLQLMDRTSGTFVNYPCYNPALKKYDINFWKLFQDREHRLWAGATRGGAMYLFNEALNKWELFDSRLTNIHAINQDKEGGLWAGNYKELIAVDTKDKRHLRYPVDYPVLCIYVDSRNRIWLGSEGGGLVLFDKQKHTFRHFTEADGLPGNTILNVLEDAAGYLWCSSYNGLSRFNPDKREAHNFDVDDGLQSNEFNYNAALRLRNGQLIFGGIDGFNKFDPGTIIERNSTMRPPTITSVKVNKIPIEQTAYWREEVPVENIAAVELPFKDANLDISFVTMAFSSPGKIQYAYFLQGWDRSWNHTLSRSLTYNNLREGTYTLYIKSTNESGEWGRDLTRLQITVLPPWYRSWWAWLLYTSIAVAVIYGYLKYKTNRQKLKYEVQLARITAQNEKELSERKASFFTNITHEFRTLLTLIINPINELIHNGGEDEKPVEIKVAYNNSRRMLRLVDQLLLFRKADANASGLSIGNYKIYDLCKEVFDSFYYQAKVKNISYELCCDNEATEIFADAEKIEIAVFNLLSNALKYTPERGRIRLNIRDTPDAVLIALSDSGPGFDKTIGNRIFDQYYQVKTLESKKKPGFGLGLYLVKNFIDLHHGQLYYETEVGKGTTFYIRLFKGKTHLPENVLIAGEEPEKHLAEEILAGELELPSAEPAPKLDAIASDKKKILIVDDNETLVQYIEGIFSPEYHVLIALDGARAFSLAISELPDIIITDLNMPGAINGYDLCVKIKADNRLKHIPIILLTGEDSAAMKLLCIKSGAADYILKPFEKELLIAKVNNFIASRTHLQQYFLNHVTLKENNLNVLESEKLFLDQCIKVVEEHLYDEQFAINMLAREMGKSHSALYKKIKQLSGHTVSSFVRMIRLRKAAALLINTNCNVTEAATEAGFNDIKHFRTQFTRLFGCTPSEYIRKYRRQFQKSYTISEAGKRKNTSQQ
ncbi:hybrid sensor histidine kinase/response regulator transcription factor [Niabella drilacis]|uniref:histidine kinase n=1 Tax=Niabella drilacis (strain DSM 25811 / CCM 8410 / CCUG 62505 / LMG 26954 / E90) TaxID=1285928 RepID=A0A1G6ZJE3_NIADE|nr:hybrid sensor histidine kinase/response regulator transcription factor [Niabella drilacis]SDE02769.1 Two component regulator propeller [Niabella drilacis]